MKTLTRKLALVLISLSTVAFAQSDAQKALDRFKAMEAESKRSEFREKLNGYVDVYSFMSQIMPLAMMGGNGPKGKDDAMGMAFLSSMFGGGGGGSASSSPIRSLTLGTILDSSPLRSASSALPN